MKRYLFHIMMGACLVVLALVYQFCIAMPDRELRNLTTDLQSSASRAQDMAPDAFGDLSLRRVATLQDQADNGLKRIVDAFRRRDADNLDYWFSDLGVEWKDLPKVEDFKRFYALARDRLSRECATQLKAQGLAEARPALITYPWLESSALPTVKELRRLQREFWVQDRTVRALALVGAYPLRPLSSGEAQPPVGLGPNRVGFTRMRFDLQVACRESMLAKTLHAMDAPFRFRTEDGEEVRMALNVVIDNVSIERVTLTKEHLQDTSIDPPVELNFFLTVLDYGRKENGI